MITEAEVHAACDTIDGRGDEPKYALLRIELGGRGSWSTIKKYRDSWIASGEEVPPVPETLHAHLLAVAAAVWRAAYPLAAGTFGEERRAAVAEIADLTAALQHAEDELNAKAVTIDRLTETSDELRARLSTVEAARRIEAERHAALAGEVAALTAMTAELQALLGGRSEQGPLLRIVHAERGRDDRTS